MSEPIMTGAALKAYREARGETQEAFATCLGISKRGLGHYETGKSPVPRYIALACAALEVGLAPMGEPEPVV